MNGATNLLYSKAPILSIFLKFGLKSIIESGNRQLLNSPLLARRLGKSRFAPAAASATAMESSDDDIDDPQATTVHNFHDLESFQKAQLLNKVMVVISSSSRDIDFH